MHGMAWICIVFLILIGSGTPSGVRATGKVMSSPSWFGRGQPLSLAVGGFVENQ